MFKKGEVLKTSQAVKKRRRIFWVKFCWTAFLLVALLVSLSFLSKADFWKITTIKINGNQVLTAEELETSVRSGIAGNYLYLFSKSNVFLYPKATIEADLLNQFKRLKSVTMDFEDFHAIGVGIVERQPYVLWCVSPTESVFKEAAENCYFMDEAGYIFASAPELSSGVYIKYHGLLTATDPVDQTYTDSAKFKAIDTFVRSLEALNIHAVSVTAKNNGDFEVYFQNNGKLIVDQKEDLSKIYHKLDVLLHDPSTSIPHADFLSIVDYIDLRFGNKLFYKLKANATATTTATSTKQ